jgi:hypothetical protein
MHVRSWVFFAAVLLLLVAAARVKKVLSSFDPEVPLRSHCHGAEPD